MRLYHFADPHIYWFAEAGRRGTWSPSPGLCPECQRDRSVRVPPLIIEWEPGSAQVGDFTWPGFNDELVVTQRVRDALEDRFCCMGFLSIVMQQHPRLRRPTRVTKRTKPRVWLPYEGPPLWQLRATTWCSLDHEASGVRLDKVCATCGKSIYLAPPFEQRHLVVLPSTWYGEDIFNIREYAGWTFCTERVKEFIEAQGFTNAGFALDGEIPTG
jgi:hypothetical protein